MGYVHDLRTVQRGVFRHRGKRRHLRNDVSLLEDRGIRHAHTNPPPYIQTMTGNEELTLTPEGLNTLRVRQSSDIFANNCRICGGKENAEEPTVPARGCKHGGP
jgi:hypothetical protein